MCTATIKFISPSGTPVTLSVGPDDDTDAIQALMERADAIGQFYHLRDWRLVEAESVGPSANELAQGPTFAGYPCSPTVDDRGLPTWIIVDGRQAQRREKQGDVWYSIKRTDGGYEQILRIPRGEKAPPVKGL